MEFSISGGPKLCAKSTKLSFACPAPKRVAGGLPVSLRGAWGAAAAGRGVGGHFPPFELSLVAVKKA